MHFTDRLNEIPKPLWILAMILGFVWFWPVGLGIALMLGSGHLGGGWRGRRCGRWVYMDPANGEQPNGAPMQNNGQQGGWGPMSWGKWGGGTQSPAPSPAPVSGNKAFDDYRSETLRRLEDEQKEFVDYLERLRQAKDKAEFDQFMADRRRPTVQPDPYRPA